MATKTFSERLTKLVSSSGKSANQIERELGYPRNALNNYKIGKCPSAQRLFELARYFKVEPEYLFGETEDESTKFIGSVVKELTSEDKKELCTCIHLWLNERKRDSGSKNLHS